MRRPARCQLFLTGAWLLLGAAAAAAEQENRRDAFITYSERTGCRDANSACEDWAKNGECSKNEGYMKTNCPVACKHCTPRDVVPQDYVGQSVVLSCSEGEFVVRPYWDRAPMTAALVLELAHHGSCSGCNLYRNEAVPQEGFGPPYGLLQGSLAGMVKVPPKEGDDIPMRRGHVAMIPNTKEFFINLMAHDGWGNSMTVWGEVDDMDVVEKVVGRSYHEVKHPQYGTVMRMLDSPLEFQLRPLNGTASVGTTSMMSQ